jgi:putative endonuclease
MATVYILFSKTASKYYTGFTSIPLDERIQKHRNHHYDNKFTAKYDDWELFLSIECASIIQAQKIERHIKEMKSSKYISNLKSYPEIAERLLQKYG